MFCAKCGAQISGSDQFCPKCGKENINYAGPNRATPLETASTYVQGVQNAVSHNENIPSKEKKWILPVIIIGIMAIICAIGFMLLKSMISGLIPSSNTKALWSPQGISGYIDKEGAIHFVDDGTVNSFEGKMKSGRSTPDHSKYLTLTEEGILQIFELQEGMYVPTTIHEKVESLSAVNNDGCFYTSGTKKHLYYYGFSDKSNVDTGLEDCYFYYSNNKNTVIGASDHPRKCCVMLKKTQAFVVSQTMDRMWFGVLKTGTHLESI